MQPTAPNTPAKKTYRRSDLILAYLLVGPLVLWLAATILYPLASAIHLSLLNVKVIGSGGDFVGFANYQQVLSNAKFWAALGRSAVLGDQQRAAATLVAFATALILKQRFRGRGLARKLDHSFVIVPTVVDVYHLRWMLAKSGGIVKLPAGGRWALRRSQSAFSAPGRARFRRWSSSIRGAGSADGGDFVGRMQGIPKNSTRAASVDGAKRLAALLEITLPSLQPALVRVGLGHALVGQCLRYHLVAHFGRAFFSDDHLPVSSTIQLSAVQPQPGVRRFGAMGIRAADLRGAGVCASWRPRATRGRQPHDAAPQFSPRHHVSFSSCDRRDRAPFYWIFLGSVKPTQDILPRRLRSSADLHARTYDKLLASSNSRATCSTAHRRRPDHADPRSRSRHGGLAL